jgi:hypothetical protein
MILKLVQPSPESMRLPAASVLSSPIGESVPYEVNKIAENMPYDMVSGSNQNTAKSSQEENTRTSHINDLLLPTSSFAMCSVNEHWAVLCFQNTQKLIQCALIQLDLRGKVLFLGEIDEAVDGTPLYCYERLSRVCVMFVCHHHDVYYLTEWCLPVRIGEITDPTKGMELVKLESPKCRVRRIKEYTISPPLSIYGKRGWKVLVERKSGELSSLTPQESLRSWKYDDSVGWISKDRIPGASIAVDSEVLSGKRALSWFTSTHFIDVWIVYAYVSEEGITVMSENTSGTPSHTLKTLIPVPWETISDKTQIKLRLKILKISQASNMTSRSSPWSEILCGYFFKSRENKICYVHGKFKTGGHGSFETPKIVCEVKENSRFEFLSIQSGISSVEFTVEREVYEYLAYFCASEKFVLSKLELDDDSPSLTNIETINVSERFERLPLSLQESEWGLELKRQPVDEYDMFFYGMNTPLWF